MSNAFGVTFPGSRYLVFLSPFITTVEVKEVGAVCGDTWSCGHIPELVKKIKSCQEHEMCCPDGIIYK